MTAPCILGNFILMNERYIDIRSIADLHHLMHYPEPKHPLVSLIEHPAHTIISPDNNIIYRIGLYSIACKKVTGSMKYGRGEYDFSNGTLMFTAPGQVIPGTSEMIIEEGWSLVFHPDALHDSDLANRMHSYTFFNYEIDEALHVSDHEQSVLKDCVLKIKKEYDQNIDKHTQSLITSNIELLLIYCNRYYDRQFLTRIKTNSDIIQRFERLLKAYFADSTLTNRGLPGVVYFASQVNLSPNYLSDVLQKFTGKTTIEHIHLEIVSQAKSLLLGTSATISEVAYILGFDHPSHLTKIFKAKTGLAPSDYRNEINLL